MMLQKISNSYNSCSFNFLFLNPQKQFFHCFKKIWNHRTVFNIDYNKKKDWAANQHIRMFSEGSSDTEDWSNDAENTALHQK